ncbi:MAG: AbrB/MazE/SpoVT family DNA-binding domain-containing protein [Chloroflexota bacterium]|nr:AbrB/MazE/SpoVT family DNA-binding domain-containing protein [Chloroflexota bacterium]
MTVVVKSSRENTISLPTRLMTILGLRDGDEVKTVVEGQSLRLTPLDQFLALRGVLREDKSFDTAMEFLEGAWSSWTIPGSV